jgi:hypothetical protein
MSLGTVGLVAFKYSYKSAVSIGLPQNQANLMPVLPNHPLASFATRIAPVPQRGSEIKKWLAPSLKIHVSNATGSGTIVYFNPEDGYAYVQSCGHLWSGTMSADEGKKRKITCQVESWYHNTDKLPTSKKYTADVLWYCNERGYDSSLSRFKPDWQPEYFPLVGKDYVYKTDEMFHSCGCDHGTEVAHYEVTMIRLQEVGKNSNDVVTKGNSPRPGRSGGGLFNDEGFFIGICWGTSNRDGSGIGLFTPIQAIHKMNEVNGYGWLNEVGQSLARKIPILDRNGQQRKYPQDYIPLPGGR